VAISFLPGGNVSVNFDLLVFIGRFQPFHLGHKAVIDKALSLSNNVAVLVGSSDRPQTAKNPWTFGERVNMLMSVYPEDNLFIDGIRDYLYDDIRWASDVVEAVNDALGWFGLDEDTAKVGLIGKFDRHGFDYSTYFPNYELVVGVPAKWRSEDIRECLFSSGDVSGYVPEEVNTFLLTYSTTAQFAIRATEQIDLSVSESFPYPLAAANAVVIHRSGQVLLTKNQRSIGKGLYALPGGVLSKGERAQDKQAVEINKAGVAVADLQACQKSGVFDHPDRNLGAREVTTVAVYTVNTKQLPAVGGGVGDSFWWPLSRMGEIVNKMCDDHADIVRMLVPGYSF
jgi:bifunctional NMN adenylyltransferase/nudix hydrolase